MNKFGLNGIRTIVVLDSMDPDDQRTINKRNPKARRSPLSIIKSGGYACVPAMEKSGNFDSPYAIFNMSLDVAKKMCGKYQQTSFVYSVLNEDGMIHSEYYTKQEWTMTISKLMSATLGRMSRMQIAISWLLEKDSNMAYHTRLSMR